MNVEPAKGALVRDPVTKLAIEAGAEVDEHDPYWSRALADGDVKPVAEKAEEQPARRAASKEGSN